MTKLDLQKELLAKIKQGIKPSDLKNLKNKNGEKISESTNSDTVPSHQNNTPASSPPASPIIGPVDKQTKQKPSSENISPPPIEIEQDNVRLCPKSPLKNPDKILIKQLQEQVNFHAQTAQTHLTNLQRATAENDNLKEQIKQLQSQPIQLSQEIEQALKEANQKIRELEAKNKQLAEKYSQLEKQAKPTAKPQPQEIKTFLCSDCKQTKPQAELSRVFNNFSFCRSCSQKARKQAQTRPQPFTCHTCQQTKTEAPAKMKLDQTLTEYLICQQCRPNLKEFNEADLITDELWLKYPYSSASEILEKEFGIVKEETW